MTSQPHASNFRIERGAAVLEIGREAHEFVVDLNVDHGRRGDAITVLREEAAALRDWLDAELEAK